MSVVDEPSVVLRPQRREHFRDPRHTLYQRERRVISTHVYAWAVPMSLDGGREYVTHDLPVLTHPGQMATTVRSGRSLFCL